MKRDSYGCSTSSKLTVGRVVNAVIKLVIISIVLLSVYQQFWK